MSQLTAADRFQKLVNDISGLYSNVRKMQIQFSWETGRRIVQEEQNGEIRARYGSRLIFELSKELSKRHGDGFSERTLLKMRRFFVLNKIPPRAAELTWSHYDELLQIRDEKTRKRLEARALKENLNRDELRQIVLNIRQGTARNLTQETAGKFPPLKRPGDLKLNTFARSKLSAKIEKDKVLLDCGFFVSWPVKKEELPSLKVLDQPSYTYSATVDRVIDGDTLLVLIEVGFGIIVRDKLRLRGIDTPELGTREGEAAKRWVEKILPSGSTLVIKTHKCATDTYGRFVADVFYRKGATDAEAVLEEAVYLNQELLDAGLAKRMNE